MTKPGAEVRLDAVRFVGEPAVRYHRELLREVPVAASRGTTSVRGWEPVDSARGRVSAARRDLFRGTIRPFGGTIRGPCKPGDPSDAFTELLTEVAVGPEGINMRRTLIDYTCRGKPYTLVVRWSRVACGTRTPPEECTDQ